MGIIVFSNLQMNFSSSSTLSDFTHANINVDPYAWEQSREPVSVMSYT